MIFPIVVYIGGYLLTLSSFHLLTKYNKYLNGSKNKWQLLINFTKAKMCHNNLYTFSYQTHCFVYINAEIFKIIDSDIIEVVSIGKGNVIYLYKYADLDNPNSVRFLGVTTDTFQIYEYSYTNNSDKLNVKKIFTKIKY